MLSLPLRSPAGDVTAVHAYDVAVTDTLKSYPTLNFSFVANEDNEVAEKMIAPRAIITDPTTGQQYRIATSNPVPTNKYRVYAVTTIHIAHDLHDLYLDNTITGSQSLKACCDFLVSGSKFTYSIDGNISDHDFGSDTLGNAHGDDVLSSIAEAFGIEFWFDNTMIHLATKIGKDNSFVFIDKVNASKIQVNEDYTTIETAIKGTGKEIEQDNTGGDSGGGSGAVASFARQYAGTPYVWGGSSPSGWDCSGFVAYVYNHFGIPMHQPTTYEEYQGQVVGPPYQEGDMLFWGARGSTYHVALALDSNTLEMAANPERGTVIQAISAWPPAFGVRNAQMAAKVQGSSDSDDSSTTDTTDQPPQYTCQGEYDSPMADDKKWGKIWADPFTSDTITDENSLKDAMKAQLHDYPDVQYTMDWVSFKNNLSGINNEIAIGNNGWLRDRFGIDVNVRIQSFTQYKDPTTTQTDTITFGNKIFGPDEWSNRNDAARTAIHSGNGSSGSKSHEINPPVTADDIPTNGVQLRSPNGKVYTLTAGDDGKLKLSTEEGEDTNGDKGQTTHS